MAKTSLPNGRQAILLTLLGIALLLAGGLSYLFRAGLSDVVCYLMIGVGAMVIILCQIMIYFMFVHVTDEPEAQTAEEETEARGRDE